MVNTLQASSTIINNMISEFAEARKYLTQISSGTYNKQNRKVMAEGINDILEQMVTLANTKNGSQYLFGGSDTTSAPYIVERVDGQISKVTYCGNYEQLDVEVAPGLEQSAFYVGDRIFRSDSREAPIFLGSTGAKAGTGTSSVTGDTWLTVTGSSGNYDLSIDGGLSTFHTDGTDTNLAVTDSRTGQVLYVDCTAINSTGVDMVSVPGTYDIFNTLINLRDILKNEGGFSEEQLQELLENAFNSLEEVSTLLTQTSTSVGYKIQFLDGLKENLEDIKVNSEDELTRLQEADIAQIALDLSRREVLYQLSLSVAAKIMSMSLLDFIG
jgi:flagellar hook-associated protein 3 FlgL